MFNILVINDNLRYSKNLINFILKNNSSIKLIGIASNGKEALNYLTSKEYNIDIILLDLKLPYYNGIKLLENLKMQNLSNYDQSIIVISAETSLLSSIINEKCIYSYINKIEGFEKILNELNNLIELKTNQYNEIYLQDKILKELKYLNYNDKFIGTKYLLEAITLIAKNTFFNSTNLKRDVYPIIASKHKKTVHNIKCNINNATVIMNCDCKKEVIMQYFHFNDKKSEAKPKQVIDTILSKLNT